MKSTSRSWIASLALALTAGPLLAGCDGSQSTQVPADDAPAVQVIEAEMLEGPWSQAEHFCVQLDAEACEENELVVGMLSSERSVAAGAGNMIELVRMASRTSAGQSGHLLLRRGDEGLWALPPLNTYDPDDGLERSMMVKRAEVPEGGPANLLFITYADMVKQGELWDTTERIFVCNVDPDGPVACAALTTIRLRASEGVDETLPYLESIVTPKAGGEGVFEVTRISHNEGEASFGAEVIADQDFRIVFP